MDTTDPFFRRTDTTDLKKGSHSTLIEMHQQSSKLPAMFKTVLKLRICLAALLQLALNVHLRSKIQRPTELGPH
jgi:hypothetical protein